MKKEPGEDIKSDLKHDTMEFAASTDGEDSLDTDDPTYEEEEITAEELDIIEDVPENEAFAINAAETDSQADATKITETSIPVQKSVEMIKKKNHHRNK